MRVFFLIALLVGAIFYSYVAFTDLGFLTRTGRLGPGFFPRLIGVFAVATLIWVIVEDIRKRQPDVGPLQGWFDVFAVIALSVFYAVLLRLFGGLTATVIFLVLALSFLNRGEHLKNLVIAVAVPAAVFLLFDKVLNANMPPALIKPFF